MKVAALTFVLALFTVVMGTAMLLATAIILPVQLLTGNIWRRV